MKKIINEYSFLVVVSTLLIGFSLLAISLHLPKALDSRDSLIIACGLCGLVFAGLAINKKKTILLSIKSRSKKSRH